VQGFTKIGSVLIWILVACCSVVSASPVPLLGRQSEHGVLSQIQICYRHWGGRNDGKTGPPLVVNELFPTKPHYGRSLEQDSLIDGRAITDASDYVRIEKEASCRETSAAGIPIIQVSALEAPTNIAFEI
jgi:hypothetical protein